MGDDVGKIEWTTLIAVLRAGTVMIEEGDPRVLVRFIGNVLMTVVSLENDADGVAVDTTVLLALTGLGTTVNAVALRDA
jgi:hypothetical protein